MRDVWCAPISPTAALFTTVLLVVVLAGWKGMALAVCIIGVLGLYSFNRLFSNPFEFLCVVCLWFGECFTGCNNVVR